MEAVASETNVSEAQAREVARVLEREIENLRQEWQDAKQTAERKGVISPLQFQVRLYGALWHCSLVPSAQHLEVLRVNPDIFFMKNFMSEGKPGKFLL